LKKEEQIIREETDKKETDDVKTMLRYFEERKEILWFEKIEGKIITDPMELVKAIRTVINHTVLEHLDGADNDDARRDLDLKGVITFNTFDKIYQSAGLNPFKSSEIWSFLKTLGLAYPLQGEGSEEFVLIPSLINNKTENINDMMKDKKTMEDSSTTMVLQYTSKHSYQSTRIFYDFVRTFVDTFLTEGDLSNITRSYSQKVESRELGLVAGIQGVIDKYHQRFHFMLLFYETPLINRHGMVEGSFVREGSVQIYIQPIIEDTSKAVTITILRELDQQLNSKTQNTHRSMPCKKCKEEGREGSFKVDKLLEKLYNTCNTIERHELGDDTRQLWDELWDDICPICLDKLFVAPVITSCGHTFCWCCIVTQRRSQHEGRFKCSMCKEIYASVEANFAIPGSCCRDMTPDEMKEVGPWPIQSTPVSGTAFKEETNLDGEMSSEHEKKPEDGSFIDKAESECAFQTEEEDPALLDSHPFQQFMIPQQASVSILGGAMRITCTDHPITVRARLCPSQMFYKIAAEMSEVHGPMVDIHLVEPPDKLPPGVEIGIKHFLSVPHSPDIRDGLEADNHSHHFLKATNVEGKLEIEVIESFPEIRSSYFTTKKLKSQPLCQIVSGWFGIGKEDARCSHPSPKQLVLTQMEERCPHRPNSLYLWLKCGASDSDFKKKTEDCKHEKSGVYMEVTRLNTSPDVKYEMSVKLSEECLEWVSSGLTSHYEMCQQNGVLRFGGLIKGEVNCGCGKGDPCRDGQKVFLKVKEMGGNQPTQGYEQEDNALLGNHVMCEKDPKCAKDDEPQKKPDFSGQKASGGSSVSSIHPGPSTKDPSINISVNVQASHSEQSQNTTNITENSIHIEDMNVEMKLEKATFRNTLVKDLEKDAETFEIEEEANISFRKGRDLLDVGMILDSTCLMIVENQTNRKCGTGFLAKFKNQDDAFFVTAGHNFTDENGKIPDTIEFDKYHLFFHNMYGIHRKSDLSEAVGSKYLSLKDLNPSPKGFEIAYQYNQSTRFAQNRDFFFLRVEEEILKSKDLVCLPICTASPIPNEAIWIFGHPADDGNGKGGAWNGASKLRLRASQGLVKDQKEFQAKLKPRGTSNNRRYLEGLEEMSHQKIFYDASTLRGHSGSPCLVCRPESEPVWSVIGIHNGGIPEFDVNFAQLMPTQEEFVVQKKPRYL